ncbi:ataxin-10-like isoform X1 [Haliotis rufescens]|uniref:ataxin-10-like isoform X1 n=1 Tax=Haliotis rufescens TaxID=6454 RepID=UPI00201EF431|nr:ataxin-10-like isoform X1 [Haliotis rufescens]
MFVATSLVNNMAHGDLVPLAVNGHWSQCISTLADFTQLFKSDEYRNNGPISVFNDIFAALSSIRAATTCASTNTTAAIITGGDTCTTTTRADTTAATTGGDTSTATTRADTTAATTTRAATTAATTTRAETTAATTTGAVTRSAAATDADAEHPLDDYLVKCATETFRCLRNACAGCHGNQTTIGGSPTVLSDTHAVLEVVSGHPSTADLTTLQRCALQFIGNLCVGHYLNQENVCRLFLCTFRRMLQSSDSGVVNYTCMVLHNCLLPPTAATTDRVLPDYLRLDDDNVDGVVLSVIEVTVQDDVEWGLYVVEDLLQVAAFCETFYTRLSPTHRLFVVEVVIGMLKRVECDTSTEKLHVVAMENLLYLGREVKTYSHQILQAGLQDSHDSQTSLLLVKILEALGAATSLHSLYGSLQNDSDLLVCCINLLHGIHEIGRQGGNHFTAVEKMTESDQIDPHHPAFGLKRDLIRLLANMVFHHKVNQDKVRELDGIALILDQSNMDGKNPFITQWVVLAIRNLCEDNADNKQYLAGLRLEGLANNVTMLQEFGVKAELQGDKIVVRRPDEDAQGDRGEGGASGGQDRGQTS